MKRGILLIFVFLSIILFPSVEADPTTSCVGCTGDMEGPSGSDSCNNLNVLDAIADYPIKSSGYFKPFVAVADQDYDEAVLTKGSTVGSDDSGGFGMGYPDFTNPFDSVPHRDNPSLNMTDVYDIFTSAELGLDDGTKYEITKLQYTIDVLPIMMSIGADEEYCYSIHGNPDLTFETGSCKECTLQEVKDENCFAKTDVPPDKQETCFIVNDFIKSCDYTRERQPFCEGVEGVGPNIGMSEPGEPIEMIGVPGYGGCQMDRMGTYDDDFDNTGIYREGRDWAGDWDSEKSDENSFMSAFYTHDDFDLCCGDELSDQGQLSVESGDKNRNLYVCMNESFRDGVDPKDYIWAAATNIENSFMIHDMERYKGRDDINIPNYDWFSMASNGEDWFACSPDRGRFNYYRLNEFPDLAGARVGDNRLLPSIRIYRDEPGTSGDSSSGNNAVDLGWSETETNDGGGEDEQGSGGDDLADQDAVYDSFDADSLIEVTACDHDGDGFDEEWLDFDNGADSDLFPKFDPDCDTETYDAEMCCHQPIGPFDCNESDVLVNPGRVEYCDNGIDDDCNDATSDDLEDGTCVAYDDGPGDVNWEAICVDEGSIDCARKYMCLYEPWGGPKKITYYGIEFELSEEYRPEETIGSWNECAGYSLDFARNDPPDARRQGSALRTLREFRTFAGKTCGNASNCVAVFGWDTDSNTDITQTESFFSPKNDIQLNRLSTYKGIEFYVFYTANFLLDLSICKYVGPDGDGIVGSGVDFEGLLENAPLSEFACYWENVPVIDFSVDEPVIGEWLHIKMPFDKLVGYTGDMITADAEEDVFDVIRFTASAEELEATGDVVYYGDNTKGFNTIIALDKISMLPKPGKSNRYCAGGYPYTTWITDLDNNTPVNGGGLGSFGILGYGACEDTPGRDWTGERCCGDDNKFTASTSRLESYMDNRACILGEALSLEQRFMILESMVNMAPRYSICSGTRCVYGLPVSEGNTVENLHTDEYSMAFTNTVTDSSLAYINPIETSTYKHDRLLAYDIPLKILYTTNDDDVRTFYTCNGPAYLNTTAKETSNKGNYVSPVKYLIKEGEHFSSKGLGLDTCSVAKSYYCSHADGKDEGWADEKLFNVSQENDFLSVEPTTRTTGDKVYNLIKNGDFEDDY